MYQRDYLLRIIEQLTAILIRVVLHKEAKNYAKALIEIELAYQTLLLVDPNRIKNKTTDDLLDWLRVDGIFDVEKALVIAELLREEAEIRELESRFNDALLNLLIKAFCLYDEAIRHDSQFAREKYAKKVEKVVQKINKYELPLAVQFRLFQYYERSGALDKAEDLLHELADRDYPNILVEGKAFYTRLLEKSDADLSNGRLPRDEVYEGLAHFDGRTIEPTNS